MPIKKEPKKKGTIQLLNPGIRKGRIDDDLIGFAIPLSNYREVRIAIPEETSAEEANSIYARLCSFMEKRHKGNEVRTGRDRTAAGISLPVYMFLAGINLKDIEDGVLAEDCFEEYNAYALEVDNGQVLYLGLPRSLNEKEIELIKQVAHYTTI